MARNPRRIDAALQELYDRVPKMADCRGLCADSCGPIEASVRERERIERRTDRKLEARCGSCSMLTPLGRCSVYEDRPMICRLFGTTKTMACEHGCEPERWLTADESWELLLRSLLVGGPPAGMTVDPLRRAITTPGILAELELYARAIDLAKKAGLR